MSQPVPPDYMPWNEQPPPPRNKRTGLKATVLSLILILAVLVILNETVFRISSADVQGTRRISKSTVLEAAGLNRFTNYFSVNEEKIAKGINSNRYLVFEKLEKVFPNALIIYVRERSPVAKAQEMGAVFQMDEEGMVLEQSNVLIKENEENDGLIIITGLKPKELRVGRKMVAGTESQEQAYLLVIQELTLQGYLGQVSELNLSDPDNIYLTTRDGYNVRLGDISDLRAKIGTVRAVVAELRAMELKGGLLEATIPGEVIYNGEQ